MVRPATGGAVPADVSSTEIHSAPLSTPSGPPQAPDFYVCVCRGGDVAVSRSTFGMLCEQGYLFRKLWGAIGTSGSNGRNLVPLYKFGITWKAMAALVLSLKTNDPAAAYKYRMRFERIGGFKNLNRHHRSLRAPAGSAGSAGS